MNQMTLKEKTPLEQKFRVSELDGRSALIQLIEASGAHLDTISGDQLQRLADRLTVAARGGKTKLRAWSRSYLHQVAHGKLEPSQRLTHSVIALLNEAGGISPLITRAHPVQVNALGNVLPGTVIFGDSRACANPYCDVNFLPRTWNQRYCCPECRRKAKEGG